MTSKYWPHSRLVQSDLKKLQLVPRAIGIDAPGVSANPVPLTDAPQDLDLARPASR